jgi:DNA-binding transcriptional MerR regulator
MKCTFILAIIMEYSKKEVEKIFGLKRRQIQFYTDQQVVLPITQGGLGRGRKQLFSKNGLIEFGIIKVLFDWGMTVKIIRKVIEELRTHCSGELYKAAYPAGRRKDKETIWDKNVAVWIFFPGFETKMDFGYTNQEDIMEGKASGLTINLTSLREQIQGATKYRGKNTQQ